MNDNKIINKNINHVEIGFPKITKSSVIMLFYILLKINLSPFERS